MTYLGPRLAPPAGRCRGALAHCVLVGQALVRMTTMLFGSDGPIPIGGY